MKKPADGHIRNPTGLLVPMEDRSAAMEEVLQAVNDRYPPEKDLVWNLTVIDQILENPDLYPVMNRLLQKAASKDQRRIVTGVLREARFTPDKEYNSGSACPFYRRPEVTA
jgi:hypothetical protein